MLNKEELIKLKTNKEVLGNFNFFYGDYFIHLGVNYSSIRKDVEGVECNKRIVEFLVKNNFVMKDVILNINTPYCIMFDKNVNDDYELIKNKTKDLIDAYENLSLNIL